MEDHYPKHHGMNWCVSETIVVCIKYWIKEGKFQRQQNSLFLLAWIIDYSRILL